MSAFTEPEPLRIGFVMLHTSPLDVPGTKDAGGMNVVVREQAQALAAAGHCVRIYTRRAAPDLARTVSLVPGLQVVHIDAGPARLLAKAEHETVIDDFAERLIEELTREPVDLLHAEHWFSGVAALPAARAAGIPLVQSFHSIAVPHESEQPGERPETPGRLLGERMLAREADLLAAVSEAERRTMIEDLGAATERTVTVPLGVDTELFRPCAASDEADRLRWMSVGGRPEVLVIGRLHPLKGFDLALEAVAAIPEPQRPILRIVGASPPDGDDYAAGLHEQAARLGILGTTAFEGALRRTDLAERIRRAALLLVPSHTETFGLVALEAAASGVPVIARAAGGLREAVRDGETGVLIAGGDPREWAAEIVRLLEDPDRAAKMGRAARVHALSQSWGASALQLTRVYTDLLAARSMEPQLR